MVILLIAAPSPGRTPVLEVSVRHLHEKLELIPFAVKDPIDIPPLWLQNMSSISTF